MMIYRRALMLFTLALAGCQGLPVAQATARNPMQLDVFPIPSCLFWCIAHLSVVREDLSAIGQTGALAGGTHSVTQSSTAQGGDRQ